MTPAKKALAWSFAMNFTQLVVTALVTFAVAAIVGPKVFGAASVSILLLLLFQILAGQFFIAVIIQRKNLSRTDMNTVFAFSIIWGVALSAVVAGFHEYWGQLNNDSDAGLVLLALSPLIFLRAFSLVPRGLLMREMKFRLVALSTVSASVVSGIGGIVLALNGFEIWALVAQQWLVELVASFLIVLLSGFRPRLEFSISSLKDMYPFARGAFFNELGGFFQSKAESLIIGILFGPIVIGLYRVIDRIVQIIVSILTRSIASVLFPYASQYQNDVAKLRDIVIKSIRLSTGLSFPILGVLAGLSSLVLSVLGDEWVVAWVGLSVLTLVGAIQSFALLTPHLLQAVGRPGVGALMTWGTATGGILALSIAAAFVGEISVLETLLLVTALRVVLFSTLNAPLSFLLLKSAIDLPALSILKVLLPSVAAMITAFSLSFVLSKLEFFSEISVFVTLPTFSIVSLCAALVVLCVLNRDFYSQVRGLFLGVFRKITRKYDGKLRQGVNKG